jgi:hypothetical protein
MYWMRLRDQPQLEDLWDHLVVETMTGLARDYPHPWIAPMSLLNAAYRAEIFDGILAVGAGRDRRPGRSPFRRREPDPGAGRGRRGGTRRPGR